jgi:SPP1 gp7 family putative phage head morphogenesis protein
MNAQLLQQIDDDRKKREDDLFLLLLALSDEAYDDATRNVYRDETVVQRVTQRFFPVGRDGRPSLKDVLNEGTATAFRAGVALSAMLLNAKPTQPAAIPQNIGLAANVKQLPAQLIVRLKALTDTGKPVSRDEIKTAFDESGFSKDNPYAIKNITDTQVNTAYQAGLFTGWRNNPAVSGLYYDATLDDSTTPICLAYNGTQLPVNHPWWFGHTPSCHYLCRSTITPILGKFTPTANPPETPPPMPGFGMLNLSRNLQNLQSITLRRFL